MASLKHLHKGQVLWFAWFCAACSFTAGVPASMREHKIKGNSIHIFPLQPTHRSKAVDRDQKMIHCYPHPSCILCDHIYHLYSKRLTCWKESKRFECIFPSWKPSTFLLSARSALDNGMSYFLCGPQE